MVCIHQAGKNHSVKQCRIICGRLNHSRNRRKCERRGFRPVLLEELFKMSFVEVESRWPASTTRHLKAERLILSFCFHCEAWESGVMGINSYGCGQVVLISFSHQPADASVPMLHW